MCMCVCVCNCGCGVGRGTGTVLPFVNGAPLLALGVFLIISAHMYIYFNVSAAAAACLPFFAAAVAFVVLVGVAAVVVFDSRLALSWESPSCGGNTITQCVYVCVCVFVYMCECVWLIFKIYA